jgi:hypothetical protein
MEVTYSSPREDDFETQRAFRGTSILKLALSMAQPATQELREPHQETGSFSKRQLLKGEADRDASDVDSSAMAQPL